MTPRLKAKYAGPASQKLRTVFGITNPMALPRLDRIMVTVGVGKQLEGTRVNAKAKDQVIADLALITGQKPVMTKAKRAVSNFKVRIGYEVGCIVTLRGNRMWEFLDRLVSLAIPRVKDFRGLKTTSFDGQGNYSMGVTEQGIFPEVDMGKVEFPHGMNITFVIHNSDPSKSLVLLKELGMPFAKTAGESDTQAA